MKKLATEKAIEVLPEIISNVKDWLKTAFEDHAQDVLDGASGTVGLIIKILAKNVVENYFDKLSQRKLENFGTSTYLKASYAQACKSIMHIEKKLNQKASSDEIIQSLEEVLQYESANFSPDNIVLVFQPIYHPAVVSTKNAFVNLLTKIKIEKDVIDDFIRNFNDNIQQQIEEEFGSDYNKHLGKINKYILEEKETELLLDMVGLGKIGFSEDESLSYETTYAEWMPVHAINNYSAHSSDVSEDIYNMDRRADEFTKRELSLKPVTDLIDNYFKNEPSNHLEKILFLIADFGKGKSVFLKYYTSILAKQYLSTGEGYIPIYFNLRNFANYSSVSSLGILHDYLQTEYAINISSDYYKVKKYIFLVDSLDESGELNKYSVEKVIDSVKRIQNLDKTLYRTNKIIISSRPFDGGLQGFLEQHKPYTIKSKNKDISYYISLFGFKSIQFNSWLNNTLKSAKFSPNEVSSDFVKNIFANIKSGVETDIYSELLSNKTLSRSELQRPIFAYMIYQLIINNVDFLRVGKIGVYLSFLNLLSKEAKHINDPSYKVNIREEFEFRNLLHAISSLWMYERHQGKQGALNKADICRVLDGEKSGESDTDILARYKNNKVLEIEFLSHSYFGENNNTLHFQHQSFAEILLAEYYLKVFIKFALDEGSNIEEARAKLVLGQPTDQTVKFFVELLQLLKESSADVLSEEVIQKRKLLFPLLASLSIRKNNLLMSNELAYNWFNRCSLDELSTEYPEQSIMKWCINRKHLEKICTLAQAILGSKNNYYLISSERKSALFNNELTLIKNNKIANVPIAIDRWLALIVGNTLYNDLSNETALKLFNTDYQIDAIQLFNLLIGIADIKKFPRDNPSWARELFMGVDMRLVETEVFVSKYIAEINFSYSYFKNIDFMGSILVDVDFSNCSFENANFSYTTLYRVVFDRIQKLVSDRGGLFVNVEGKIVPFDLFDISGSKRHYVRFSEKINIPDLSQLYAEKAREFPIGMQNARNYYDFLEAIRPFILYQINNHGLDLRKINQLIYFENNSDKEKYLSSLK